MEGSGAKVSAVEVQSIGAPKLLAGGFDGRILDLSRYFEPAADVKLEHDGTVHRFEIVTRDFGADSLGIVRWRKHRLRYEMEAAEGDEPFLRMDIGSGLRLVDQPRWGEVKWSEFKWAASAEIEWVELSLPGPAPANAGKAAILAQNAHDFYSAEFLRFCRLRIRTTDPVAKLTIRGLEVSHAPTGGVRHSKVT
jgi:hypothetical protein